MRKQTPFVPLLLVAGCIFLPPVAAGVQTGGGTTSPAQAKRANLIDLNTATIDQLKTLPGIGAAYARRIVEGRPYLAKNQLATRGVLPQSAYERIKDQVVAHRAGPA